MKAISISEAKSVQWSTRTYKLILQMMKMNDCEYKAITESHSGTEITSFSPEVFLGGQQWNADSVSV